MTSNDAWLHQPNPTPFIEKHFLDLLSKFQEGYDDGIPFDKNSFTIVDGYVWSNNYGASFDVRVAVSLDIMDEFVTWNISDIFTSTYTSGIFQNEDDAFKAVINNPHHLDDLLKTITKYKSIEDNKAKIILEYKRMLACNNVFNLKELLFFYMLNKKIFNHT